MRHISKRIKDLFVLKTRKAYKYLDAIQLLKKFANTNFLETAEAHINLNFTLKKPKQQICQNIVLPHGTGKKVKIAVYSEKDNATNLLNMGATRVGGSELISEILAGNINFDVLLTTPALAPNLTAVGKILGPKGLMPSQSSGTVTSDLEGALSDFNRGRIEFKADKHGILHLIFGNMSFSDAQLADNLRLIYETLKKNKPLGTKGSFITSVYICTTMSPSLRIDLPSFEDE